MGIAIQLLPLQSLHLLLLLHLLLRFYRLPLLFFLFLGFDASPALILVVICPGCLVRDSHRAEPLQLELQAVFDAVPLRREVRAACRAVLACGVGGTHFLSFFPPRGGGGD
jgi:hypothetical protein